MSNQISVVCMYSNINPNINPILLFFSPPSSFFTAGSVEEEISGIWSWDRHLRVWGNI